MLKKLLVTGAAGGIGQMLIEQLGSVADSIRYSDIVIPAKIPSAIEFVQCDLCDQESLNNIINGCDGILHLGGISVENTFNAILQANIIGIHNLYESARKNGHPRIFLASSNHVVGFYHQNENLDHHSSHLPDSWYGVSKSFAEAVALMYFHKYGQETAIVRIGSCLQEPKDHRMLSTWLSAADFISLVGCVFNVSRLGCPIIYGMSNNHSTWWDNSGVAYLGWRPKDNSEQFRKRINATVQLPDKDDPAALYQGGMFATNPIIVDKP